MDPPLPHVKAAFCLLDRELGDSFSFSETSESRLKTVPEFKPWALIEEISPGIFEPWEKKTC